MKKIILFLFIGLPFFGFAQTTESQYKVKDSDPNWVHILYSENPNIVELRDAFEIWHKDNPDVKNRDTQYYKRFMRTVMPFVNAEGIAELPANSRPNEIQFTSSSRSANWQEAGPWHYDPEVAMTFQVQSPGACHVYVVDQSISEPETVWAGTATAGLWKSTDKGLHWNLMTRDMVINEVYSIAIDPENVNRVYFGEGNGKIWTTEDGGLSWTITGDTPFQSLNHWVRELRVKPDNNQVVFAATSNGLYRSDDFAQSWTSIESGEFMEIEFHPTNADIVYAVKRLNSTTQFWRSTNGGSSFTNITSGWPNATSSQDQRRTEIAVTPNNPNRIYALAAGEANGGSGLFGIYISDDAGLNWNFQCCGSGPGGLPEAESNPNILGWSGDGSEDGGQYYYDLALDVSPTDDSRLFGAGISVWRSLNAGQDWELNGHWVTWAGENTMQRYTHADVHFIKFFQTETSVDMWIASDGGLYYSSDQGDNIEPRMYGLHGTDFWGWQAGFKAGDVMAGGTYHNGTLIKNNDLYYWGFDQEDSGGWLAELAGDNFRGFINPGDPTVGYHDGGAFRFSEDRFTRISSMPFDNSKAPNTSYFIGEYGNLEWDPRCINHIYSPVDAALWKTTNGGLSWELIHDFGGSKIVQVKVSRTNPDVIYVTHRQNGSVWKIWRTSNQGLNWTDITPTQFTSGSNANKAKYIDVDGQDENTVWTVALGGYNSDNRILKSTNGGSSWQNLTGSLSGENLTSILHQVGTEGGIYIGTSKSVFYGDNTMSDWVQHADGLPASTQTVFLQADYCTGKIRSAGSRGVHEGDLYSSSEIVANFMSDALSLNVASSCDEQTIRFFDNSVVQCDGTSYEWLFPGGNPSSSDEMNPEVVYSEPGEYSVTLTVSDLNGNSNTLTRTNFVSIVSEPFGGMPQEDFNQAAFPPNGWKLIDEEGNGAWEHATEPADNTNGVAQFPNYWVNATDQTDLLLLPALDFSSLESPIMTFDVSYRTYAEYIDGLAVVYKTANNPEWLTLYEELGDDLSVAGNYTWFWYDTGGEVLWDNKSIDLGALVGENCVQLAFKNIGGYGNHIWVDNVNINVSTNTDNLFAETFNFLIYPNPTNGDVRLRVNDALINADVAIHNSLGQVVFQARAATNEKVLPLGHLAPGIYTVTITNGKSTKSKRLIKSK
jgi:PKD repeat protein